MSNDTPETYRIATWTTGHSSSSVVHIADDTAENGIKCYHLDPDRATREMDDAERKRRGLTICTECAGERRASKQSKAIYRLARDIGKEAYPEKSEPNP